MNWQPYLIAIMIGLLIGIERERSHSSQSSIGVRTFLLVSLLGAITGDVENPWIAFVLSTFALGLIFISYFNQTRQNNKKTDFGLTTEFAAGLVFSLGYIAHKEPTLAAVTGPIVAVLLFSKSSLHKFIKNIKPIELQSALFLFLAGVVIINLVPDHTIDPWGVFNPKKFGFLVLTLASLEYFGYISVKIIGEKNGRLIIGFLGGLVSSTAVLLFSAKQAKQSPSEWRTLFVSTVAAKIAALVELLLIVYFISESLFKQIGLPVFSIVLMAGLSILVVNKNVFGNKSADENTSKSTNTKDYDLNLKSPLDWKGVLKLSVTLAGILGLISLAKLWIGDEATTAISFLTGLFELHGVSLANATMFKQNQLSLESANFNILLAVVASLVAKLSLTWAISRNGAFAKVLTLSFTLMIIALIFTSYNLLH